MFGLTEADVAGSVAWPETPFADQLENRDELVETWRRIWADPSHDVLDTMWFRDGRVYSRFISPHRLGERQVGLVASFSDISQAVRIEQALEQHRTFLEKAQEVAHIGSWVAELDGSGRTGWSTETHRIFGVPVGQFVGTTDAFWMLVHPDDRDAVRAASAAAISSGAPYHIEHRIVRT